MWSAVKPSVHRRKCSFARSRSNVPYDRRFVRMLRYSKDARDLIGGSSFIPREELVFVTYAAQRLAQPNQERSTDRG